MARANPHRVPCVEAGELNIDYDLYLRITNQCGWPRWAAVVAVSPAPCDDLLAYLMCTSPDRARLIAELTARNPGVADLLMDVEADDDMRAKLEIAPLRGDVRGERS